MKCQLCEERNSNTFYANRTRFNWVCSECAINILVQDNEMNEDVSLKTISKWAGFFNYLNPAEGEQ